jgi:hypothetical protein
MTSQAEEVEREKKLILEGKIPVEGASKELMNHPVFRISQLTKGMIEGKKTKVSALRWLPRGKSEHHFPGEGGEVWNLLARHWLICCHPLQ